MSYVRVIPRDLFNEADLLKCLGQLYLKLEARAPDAPGTVNLEEGMEIEYTDGFEIRQNALDGSIHAAAVQLIVNGECVDHFRPLNARSKWPLYIYANDNDIRVFDDEGELSDEFKEFIGEYKTHYVVAS